MWTIPRYNLRIRYVVHKLLNLLLVCIDFDLTYATIMKGTSLSEMGSSICKATSTCLQLGYVYKNRKQKNILYVTAILALSNMHCL